MQVYPTQLTHHLFMYLQFAGISFSNQNSKCVHVGSYEQMQPAKRMHKLTLVD